MVNSQNLKQVPFAWNKYMKLKDNKKGARGPLYAFLLIKHRPHFQSFGFTQSLGKRQN